METLQSLLGTYYGLDWLTLMLGVSGSYITTNLGKLHIGMSVGLFTCTGGMAVAAMSDQNGFIVYNAILMGLNFRGLYKHRQKEAAIKLQTSDAQAPVPVRSTVANDQAPARDPYLSAPAVAA